MIPFDKRDGLIWYNGRLVPWGDVRVHVLSHGLHYASCVFEGERAYNGKIFKESEHHDRLAFSAKRLGFALPLGRKALDEAVQETVQANGVVDGYVRPIAWRGTEMMAISAQKTTIHMAIAAWKWPSYFTPEQRLEGISLQIAQWRRPPAVCAPTDAKAAGLYVICTLAKHEAEAKGFHDALMLDTEGNVAETTGANIFFVKEQTLYTPTPTCFLDGITRRTVMELAKKRGIRVVECTILPKDLGTFSEAFITGTAAEVTLVRRIGDILFSEPNTLSSLLVKDYEDLTRSVSSG